MDVEKEIEREILKLEQRLFALRLRRAFHKAFKR